MTAEEYIKERLEDQIGWYSKESKKNQNWHKTIQVIKIILAVSIPVVSLLIGDETVLKIVVSVIGALIAILEAVSRLNTYKDLWVKYRMSSESLKREKILFETKAAPFDGEDAYNLLVTRCEKIMSSENQFWTSLQDEIEAE